MYYVPFLANYSMLYPGAGSLEISQIRANRSRQFPTAMSIVSPNILYLFSLYAIIYELPPETYRIVGLSAPVTRRPISTWATQ